MVIQKINNKKLIEDLKSSLSNESIRNFYNFKSNEEMFKYLEDNNLKKELITPLTEEQKKNLLEVKNFLNTL